MGLAQSHAELFSHEPPTLNDGEPIDPIELLYRVERTLWRREPAWLKPLPREKRTRSGSNGQSSSEQRLVMAESIDPMSAMSPSQAMALLPSLMDEKWVAALVSLVDSIDAVIQTSVLAVLARVIRSDAAESVFIKVHGVEKLMMLVNSKAQNTRYLSLEVIFAMCSRNERMVENFSEHGIVHHLAALISQPSTNDPDSQTVVAALKILRLILPNEVIKSMVGTCRLLPTLLKLAHSTQSRVVSLAVICIGLTLPNSNNIAEIAQLGCIEALLKLMVPANAQSHMVIEALSVIADQDVTIFPKELTVMAMTRTLDTLRGGAKRSRIASATAYLFANLIHAPAFRSGLCTEQNLSILSKLLVGGSVAVLYASTFALGVAAFTATSTVMEILFVVDAPLNLLKVLDVCDDEDLIQLVLFAMSSILDGTIILPSGIHVAPSKISNASASLRQKMETLCSIILTKETAIRDVVFRYSTETLAASSSFAAKILSSLSAAKDVKAMIIENNDRVRQMLVFLKDASELFLPTLILFFIECSESMPPESDGKIFCDRLSVASSDLIEFVDLFNYHEPANLLGLMVAFASFSSRSTVLKAVLSGQDIIERVMSLLSKANQQLLHLQVLRFLDCVTQEKNAKAIAWIYARSPDRLANLLHSSMREMLFPTLTVLRRVFKYHNNPEVPSTAARRQLVNLLANEDRDLAVLAARVCGNLLQFSDKRQSLATISNAAETLLRLLTRCHRELTSSRDRVRTKDCCLVIRTISRAVTQCDDMKAEVASATSFLAIFELFNDPDERIMGFAVEAMIQIAQVPSLRRFIVVPTVLEALSVLLRGRDSPGVKPAYRIAWLKFVGTIGKRDPPVQILLAEFCVIDAILLLVHSPVVVLDQSVLKEAIESLAWLCTGDASVRRLIASASKLVDITLKYSESSRESLVAACLHLLQRLTLDDGPEDLKNKIRQSGGAPLIMRAMLASITPGPVGDLLKQRACALVRNLVRGNESNKLEFQRLGANPAVVGLITNCDLLAKTKLLVRALQALAAMCHGTTSASKENKREVLECDRTKDLLQLVIDKREPKLCYAWCDALANAAHASPQNQKKLVDSRMTSVIVAFLVSREATKVPLQVAAARLLSSLASFPANRSLMMNEAGEQLLMGMSLGLQSESHELQRYTALLAAHLATRHGENKTRIGASSVPMHLVDRLSSKQLNVLENVLQAVVKLGGHAGNKVKIGSKVCFEKLLSLVHHGELAIRKGAISAIAVLIEGNVVNKKHLLLCEASVVPELCALMKSPNGKIVESAMLILGELSQLQDQILEVSKFIDIVGIVRMIVQVNARIRRAALITVVNLTKESFNKVRFGIQECLDALISSLKSEDMLIVELATTSLANLSFVDANVTRITNYEGSLIILLKLAAASTSSKDYLSWTEARSLGLGRDPSTKNFSPKSKASPSPTKVNVETVAEKEGYGTEEEREDEDEIDDMLEPFVYSSREGTQDAENGPVNDDVLLDFSSFPARQTAVLEQTLLVISNCSEAYHTLEAVETVAIKVIGQAINHPSELVKRCACYILAIWCKKDAKNQRITTKQANLSRLIQLLKSPNLNVVESALYLLAKLAYYGDNHVKLLQLDLVPTLIQSILRRATNLTHEGLVDRAIRLLGTLVQHSKVRQSIKSEEIIADVLTQLLQIHRGLAKNTSRLIVGMLEEESLKFFLPKKTIVMLRVLLTDKTATSPKSIRNIISIFQRIAAVEEHKTTIALEDSGETVSRMIQELCPITGSSNLPLLPPNASTVLNLLACIASTRKVAMILHEKDVYRVLPLYIMTVDSDFPDVDTQTSEPSVHLHVTREMALDGLIIARHMCTILNDRAGTRLSNVDFTRRIVQLLRTLIKPTDQVFQLSLQSHEAFRVLDRLSSYSRDQQTFVEEDAVEVMNRYLQRWIDSAQLDGTVHGREELVAGGTSLDLLEYVGSVIRVIAKMAAHDVNKVFLVREGSIPLLLRSLPIRILTDDLRLLLAQTLKSLCAVPTAPADCFDTQDVVLPLFRFMFTNRHREDLLLLCLRCMADILETSVPSRQHVVGQSQVLEFLLECLEDVREVTSDKVHYAINALECLSMEPELAIALSRLDTHRLQHVANLLLAPENIVGRPTQFFAVEMIGYMASYGFAQKMGLQREMISRIVSFVDFEGDESVTGESIALALWTLGHLIRPYSGPETESIAPVSASVPQWIAESLENVVKIINAGLRESEHLGTTSLSTANALTVLLAVMESSVTQDIVKRLIARCRGLCTMTAVHLEAVEREVSLSALHLLCLLMMNRDFEHLDEHSDSYEDWSAVFRHLMEWMEVYARDPARCPGPSLSDAFTCLSQITTVEALVPEFRACINRSGLADIVGNTVTFLDPKRTQDVQDNAKAGIEQRLILLNALRVCSNLMEHTPAYIDRFFLGNMPQSIENILMADDDELIMECLICMNLLADWSSSSQLLFSSLRCVRRLAQLLGHKDLNIVAKVTPLLGLMCSRIPSLPGLCSTEGIKALCDRLTEVREWSARDRYTTRISDDCATMLLSLFSTEESVYNIFDEVDVVGNMFDIVVKHNAPEIPLRILTKISGCINSHVRLLKLLAPASLLLQGTSLQLGNTAQHLVLCVLFNLFCRADEGEHLAMVLRQGESTVLRQMLPLGRWTDVPNAASVRIVLKILYTYLSSPTYKTLFNDGKNIPALLRLVSNSSDEVSVAAAQLLLLATNEREVEISVTVEDGVAVLVRTLQKTSKWNLQCLLLSILASMCHDSEVPVLIVNEDGVSRLVHFVRERKGVLFGADERLALSCKILRYVSAAPTAGAASRIVEARGQHLLIDLLTHQESSVTSDSDRALTMEILANIATSGDVATQLADSKLHDHSMKWILQHPNKDGQGRESLSSSRKLALRCLQSMCKHSKTARQDVSTTKMPIVELLESLLSVETIGREEQAGWHRDVSLCALSILLHVSKIQTGRHMIFLRSSSKFIQRVVGAILSDAVLNLSDKLSSMQFENVSSERLGLKLLGHLLGDTTPERFRVKWGLEDLLKLSSLIEATLGDHQQKKMQLYALNAVGGAFRSDFYFPVSTQMLGNLINLLLISPSAQHAQEAECIIIKAFEREDVVQHAISGNQILEQLLIVFCQRVESRQLSIALPSSRLLSGALTLVLKVSMLRGLTVHQRFISKVITLLSTSSIAGKADDMLTRDPEAASFDDPVAWTFAGSDDYVLTRALAEYLGFVYCSMSVSTASSSVGTKYSICDALRAEVNLPALTVIVLLMLSTHQRICPHRDEAVSQARTQQPELLIWHMLSDCLDARTENNTEEPGHIRRLINAVPGESWLCFLSDLFSEFEVAGADQVADIDPIQSIIDSLRILSVVARHRRAEDEAPQPLRGVVIVQSLTAMLIRPSSGVMCSALRALSDARTGWGDDTVVQACCAFGDMVRLIPMWLALFRDDQAGEEEARILLLQLLLLLVSSGSYTEELKSAGIRDAIESNALIPASHKSLAISILSLLGYNADLNVEFEQGLERFEQASSASNKKETLGYLVNFLQLYTLTDEPLQARAIDCFMRHLVDGTTAVSREVEEANESNHGTLLRINNLLICLGKLSTSRCFVELYKEQWNLNSLLLVCFSRRRSLQDNKGYKECSVLSVQQVSDVLDIASRVCCASVATVGAVPACSSSFGTLSDTVFINAMTFLDDMKGKESTVLCERVVAVFTWPLENEDTFEIMSRYACRLRSALRFIAVMSDDGARSLLAILDTLTRRVSQIELLGELLTELLTTVYRLASKLNKSVREKLLLCILTILKRMGEDDLTACSVYEQSIQVILANVQVPAEMAARCSWDLLAVLTDLDAAVVTIFNFDGIQIMLKEFTGPTSAARPAASHKDSGSAVGGGDTSPIKRVLSTRNSALNAADRAALAAAAAVSSEVTYRRMEALKCLSKAARSRDEVLQKIGESPGIGAHLFRVLSGNSGGAGADHESSPVTTSVNQEHAAHLIARVSSQEFFRASLLSLDHISTLIESLESVHPKIVLFALEALFHLSEFPLCLDTLVRHATVPVLAQILVSPLVEESEQTQQMTELFVLGLLANMCSKKNKVICRRVVSSHLLPRLRSYVQSSSRPQLQFYAVWIIKSVSKDSELVAKLHEQRMLEVMSECLRDMEPIRTQRKAFGALCCMISGYRPGMTFVDDEGMRRLTRHIVLSMHPLVVMAHPHAHKSLARALTALEALARVEKDLLCDEVGEEPEARAIPLVVQLLESIHNDVKLKSLLVITRWVEDNSDHSKLRVQINEAALRSLATAVSVERGECLLVALGLLHTLLVVDEEIKNKLSAMTNDVLLRLLPILTNGGSPNTQQMRSLNEALKSLVAMTRTGVKPTTNTTAAALSGALDPLVELLRLSAATDNLRLNALYLLVTFAGSSMELRPRMVANGTVLECVRMLQEPHDDKLLQLCLLGIALLTGAGVDFSSAVPTLLDVIDVLLACLQSRNASVQANTVWVVSNICEEERLKAAIVNRGGATTLQAVLNETLSASSDGLGAIGSNGAGLAGQARPASSSQRIREYAPKAIKSLGFAPMMPSTGSTGTSSKPPPPPSTAT